MVSAASCPGENTLPNQRDSLFRAHAALAAGPRTSVAVIPVRTWGVTIQFDSHRVELAAIYEMEHDSSVAEYFDQPPPIKLVYAIPRGRQMGVLHTPDFFVIRDHEAGWEEWKTEEELQHLNVRNPHRYLPK